MTETVSYGGDRKKEMSKSNGCGVEGTRKLTTGVVLGGLKDGEEGGLANIAKWSSNGTRISVSDSEEHKEEKRRE